MARVSFLSLFATIIAASFLSQPANAQVPPVAMIRSPHSALCAEIAGGSTASGVQLSQAACVDSAQQQWDFQPDQTGYRVINRGSRLCLTVAGGSTAQGAAAVQQTCSGAASQRWIVRPSGAAYEIVSALSNQCLEIWNWQTTSGAKLNQWGCYDAPNQRWAFVVSTAPPASGMLVSRSSGMCAHVPGASTASGTNLTQWTCGDQTHLMWDFRPATGGTYQLVSRRSGMCAAVTGASTADGAAVAQIPCAQTAANGRWTPRQKGDYVELLAAHSGKCLDIFGGSIDHGAAVIQWPCNNGQNQQWTLSGSVSPSQWSAKITLPIVPVAAATLRNGKVLIWSAYDRFAFGGDQGRTYTALFDPATNASSERLVTNTGHDMFCPGTSTLADGRIMVTGGSSSAKASIYNPTTNTWSSAPNMTVPRGYQGDTLLSTGEVLTLGGSWSGGLGGKMAEVWKENVGWRRLPKVQAEWLAGPDPGGIFRSDNHMWLYGARDGYVFHAGPAANMRWIGTAGEGGVSGPIPRGDDAYAMNGNAVMYEGGKILKAGGAPAYENVIASPAAYTVDFSRGPGQQVFVVKQKPMAFQRAFANAVALPNGQVVVLGGQTYPIPFSDARSIMAPEIWSPGTNSFTRLKQMSTPRTYHSVATLLLDGRVLVGGGGLCGGCATNHPDVEILTPPYLLNPDGSAAARPTIASAPASAALGQTISVTTGAAVRSFALVRMSSVTHSVNNDQRRVPLTIASSSGNAYQLALPADRGALIPGDWMLFAMDAKGAPSVAKVVRVQ